MGLHRILDAPKALVTVELQLCSDLLISLGCANGIKDKIYRLFCSGFVSDNAVVVEVSDHREVKESLPCADVRNICYPLLVWPICNKITVEKIRIAVERLSILHISFSPNDRKQTILIHHSKHSFRIMMDSVPFQPDMDPAVAVDTPTFSLAFTNLLGQRQILCRYLHSFYIPIITAAGNAEETAHFTDVIFLTVTIDHLVFGAGFHSFPVSERKSRIRSFSICNAFLSLRLCEL